MPATSQSPGPTKPPGLNPKALFEDIAHGFWSALSHSPWLAVPLAVLLVGSLVRFVRGIIHSGHPKDPTRRFSRAERRIIFERAGGRCEHHVPIFGRCRATTGLQADHVHPHSRGGWTSLSNAQALCQRHNRDKSAHVPWNRQLNNLAKRRGTYFGPGQDPGIVRHRPRTAGAADTPPTSKGRASRES